MIGLYVFNCYKMIRNPSRKSCINISPLESDTGEGMCVCVCVKGGGGWVTIHNNSSMYTPNIIIIQDYPPSWDKNVSERSYLVPKRDTP